MERSREGDKHRNIERRNTDKGRQKEKITREIHLRGKGGTSFLGSPLESLDVEWVELDMHSFPSSVPTQKMPRLLTTSASAVRKLMLKAELMGIDTQSLEIQEADVAALVDIHKKWHIQPAFSQTLQTTLREQHMAGSISYPWLPTPREDCIGTVHNYSDRSTLGRVIANAAFEPQAKATYVLFVEFIGYYLDRNNRLSSMKRGLEELLDANSQLQDEQQALRQKYDQAETPTSQPSRSAVSSSGSGAEVLPSRISKDKLQFGSLGLQIGNVNKEKEMAGGWSSGERRCQGSPLGE
uniref:Uncharacterized protein n=1 Tax=Timema shepardi TaxID=629360 RepID=A0A7R9B6M6_TIMSH|nr:unnamed protein product [Timema shepardi]